MSNKLNGKWLPHNLDGKTHGCKKNETIVQNEGTKGHYKDISLELVIKKLASIGITLDLEVLRNI